MLFVKLMSQCDSYNLQQEAGSLVITWLINELKLEEEIFPSSLVNTSKATLKFL